MDQSVAVERVIAPTDEARALVEALEAELSAEYSPEQRHGVAFAELFRPTICFYLARLDGMAAGCGGVAFFDGGLAEVKRMYVRPAARRRGVARAILARLEAEAGARGVDRLVLETGDVRHDAIRLYERAGFARCAAFGVYVGMASTAIERSIFFEKHL